MGSGDVTNSSDVEEYMVDGLYAEESAEDYSDEESSDEQLKGSNSMDTDDEDAEDEVDIDDHFDRYIREEEEDGFFDGVEEDNEVEEDGAGKDDEEEEPDDPWTFLGHDVALSVAGSGWRIAGVRHTGRYGGFMVEAAEAMIGNILRAGDLQMDALAELEDTLGIRIIHRGGSGGPDSGRHFSCSLGASDCSS